MGDDLFIHGAVAFALVVVVPVALVVNDGLQGRSRLPTESFVLTGAVATASLLFREGALAAAMCIPWFVLCLAAGIERFGRLPTSVARLSYLLPHAYLVFGAGWLIVSRFGARPLDLPTVIVELTAVHFHYAGFVAPVVISATRDRQARAKQVFLTALWLVLAASPLTAVGFVYSSTIGAVGAVTFAAGLFLWAATALVKVVPRLRGWPRALLTVASTTVFLSMTLAAVYAIGVAAGESWISIPEMARSHGVLNAVGFSLCGSLAWAWEARDRNS